MNDTLLSLTSESMSIAFLKRTEEQKNKSKRNQDNSNKKSANDTFTILGTRANTKSRLAEIQRRIGIEPNPVTPETSSQYQNIH
ncbi:unnamed protein product [Clavelina lepadiformis]|uniref:Uncharacterized protein n=1 Tax=Clavelina lepadiformis TaxID=159417 RepID=A0ABP0F6E8_CLALP